MGFAAAAAIAAVAGSAVSLIAGHQQAVQQAELAKHQAEIDKQVSEQNARASALARDRQLEVSQQGEREKDAEIEARVGHQLNAQGGSGLSVASGGFRQTRQATKILGSLEKLNIRNQNDIRAHDLTRQQRNYQFQANAADFRSKNTGVSPLGLIGGALSLGAQAYNKFNPKTKTPATKKAPVKDTFFGGI